MNVYLLISCKFTYKLTGKMNKKAKILFFCMIFVVRASFGQKNSVNYHLGNPIFSLKPLSKQAYQSSWNSVRLHLIMNANNFAVSLKSPACSAVAANFYTQNFGFFCKKELQLEKITKVPFKFRLGSVQQVDWMEGKPNATISF